MCEVCVRVRVFFIWDYVGPVLIIFCHLEEMKLGSGGPPFPSLLDAGAFLLCHMGCLQEVRLLPPAFAPGVATFF